MLIGGAILAVVLLALAAFLLLRDDAPSKAEFIDAADKICRDANDQAGEIDVDIGNPEGIEESFEEIIGISREMLGDLEELERPNEDRETLDEFFAAFEAVNQELERFAPILRGGDLDAMTEASTRLQKDAARLNAAAQEFGFQDCRNSAEV